MATKSPVLDQLKPGETIDPPKYSQIEQDYLSGLKKRMEMAKTSREQERDEFDGMPYSVYYEQNERYANTFIQPKKNREDTNFQSGTIRQKMFALLASLVNLNLMPDISAFNKESLEVQGMGNAMEDIILKTNELDKDDEKKQMRQYELLKQGTVFVEEIWDKRFKKNKKMKGDFTGKLDVKWDEKLQKAFARPVRNIIPGLNVFLGDLSKYDISEQPFVFTVDVMHYEIAKTIFGKWDRWDNVPHKIVQNDTTVTTQTTYNPNWRLIETQDDYVEVIRYQDKWNNEFAVILNGVLMTPVGLPLPWGYEDYNIAQQNLEPIHSKFAYGKSLTMRIKNKVVILDEFMKLGVLKTQRSFMPPSINISGRVLSNRVFMPGSMSHGIEPGSVVPISDKFVEGITQSELAMIQEIQESIDAETTSPTFQGQQAQGNPTATEIIELQRQAKMVLGLTVFAMSMLEWKLSWLRLNNLLAHWFQPDDTAVDDMRGVIKDKYRQVMVERSFDGEGMGRRVVIPTKDMPSAKAAMVAEDSLSKSQGRPIRLIFIDPGEVTSSKLTWQIVITPKEKRTSEVGKLMFRAFMQDAIPLQPNIAYLQERLASVWEEDPKKLFAPNAQQPMQEQQGQEGQQGAVSPRVALPTAEKAMGREMKTQVAANA